MTTLQFSQLYTPAKLLSELQAGINQGYFDLQQFSGIVPNAFAVVCDDNLVTQANAIVAAHQPDAATTALRNQLLLLKNYFNGTATPTQDQINKAMIVVLKFATQALN